MKRILLFSLLSTLLLTSCMAVQVVGSVAGGAVMVLLLSSIDVEKIEQRSNSVSMTIFFWKPCG